MKKFLMFLLVPIMAVLMIACPSNNGAKTPDLIIIYDAAHPNDWQLFPYGYGDVAVETSIQHSFILKNKGQGAAVLKEINTAALGLIAPFSLATPSGANCVSGQTLAAGATCTLVVVFSPVDTALLSGEMKVQYVAADPNANQDIRKATANMNGRGILDCSVAALAPKVSEGVQAARDKMTQDTMQGTLDGAALTRDQGVQDGYNDSYQAAYDNGYKSSQGYTAGYNAGVIQGRNDPMACLDGSLDGQADGSLNGKADGEKDGYDDGYDDGIVAGVTRGNSDGYTDGYLDGSDRGTATGADNGASDGYSDCYNTGYTDGHSDGYFDGSVSCSKKSGAKSLGAKSTVDNQQACYQQGYDATYSTSAYWTAYYQAKANNAEYQAGYQAGKTQGTNDGFTDGANDGYAAGVTDGKVDGASEIYQICYSESYTSAYTSAYMTWYDSAYDSGYYYGDIDGYAIGYDDGYATGDTDGYRDAYEYSYDQAYDSGCVNGNTDGYSDGYYVGWDKGVADYCGAYKSAKPSLHIAKGKTASLKKNFSKMLKAVKTRAIVAHGAHYKAPVFSNNYGKDQSWWKISANGMGAERFAGSRLPKILANLVDKTKGKEARQQMKPLRKLLRKDKIFENVKAVKMVK